MCLISRVASTFRLKIVQTKRIEPLPLRLLMLCSLVARRCSRSLGAQHDHLSSNLCAAAPYQGDGTYALCNRVWLCCWDSLATTSACPRGTTTDDWWRRCAAFTERSSVADLRRVLHSLPPRSIDLWIAEEYTLGRFSPLVCAGHARSLRPQKSRRWRKMAHHCQLFGSTYRRDS